MAMRERLRSHDDAVSPVVGMILVLGISIVGIAAILYWGLPAIDEMKANVEHRSLESQFQELDATIKELVAGTTEKTAKRWQPTLNRGQIGVVNETEAWVYAVIPHNDRSHSFVYGGLGDGNHRFTIFAHGDHDSIATNTVTVQADRVNSTTSKQPLIVSLVDAATPMAATSWAAGTQKEFFLFDDATRVPIANATIHFRIYDGNVKIAEAWFVPTGRIDYRLEAGVMPKTVSQNNGAVITGNGDTFALVNSPPLPPASTTNGITRHFARAVVLNGTTSFAGDDRFNVLVTLYATYTLAPGYDCAKADQSDCVEAVQIFSFGEYSDVWHQYLGSSARGYTFDQLEADGVTYLEDRGSAMGYTLLQSIIHLTGSA